MSATKQEYLEEVVAAVYAKTMSSKQWIWVLFQLKATVSKWGFWHDNVLFAEFTE